jgi:hypothetical protein
LCTRYRTSSPLNEITEHHQTSLTGRVSSGAFIDPNRRAIAFSAPTVSSDAHRSDGSFGKSPRSTNLLSILCITAAGPSEQCRLLESRSCLACKMRNKHRSVTMQSMMASLIYFRSVQRNQIVAAQLCDLRGSHRNVELFQSDQRKHRPAVLIWPALYPAYGSICPAGYECAHRNAAREQI